MLTKVILVLYVLDEEIEESDGTKVDSTTMYSEFQQPGLEFHEFENTENISEFLERKWQPKETIFVKKEASKSKFRKMESKLKEDEEDDLSVELNEEDPIIQKTPVERDTFLRIREEDKIYKYADSS
jgi:hypothetical protein